MSIKIKYGIHKLDKEEFKGLFDRLKELEQGKKYNVFVFDSRPNRTKSQNKYYWGIVLPMISMQLEESYDVNDLHEMMKAKFNTKQAEINGLIQEYAGSTSNMDTKEFSLFIDKIKQWADETLGLYIPNPRDLTDEEIISLYEKGF